MDLKIWTATSTALPGWLYFTGACSQAMAELALAREIGFDSMEDVWRTWPAFAEGLIWRTEPR